MAIYNLRSKIDNMEEAFATTYIKRNNLPGFISRNSGIRAIKSEISTLSDTLYGYMDRPVPPGQVTREEFSTLEKIVEGIPSKILVDIASAEARANRSTDEKIVPPSKNWWISAICAGFAVFAAIMAANQ